MIADWSSVSRIEIGIVSSPMPVKSNGRFAYIRQDAVTIWPQERRRARRRGAVGRHCRLRRQPGGQHHDGGEHSEDERRAVDEPAEHVRSACDRAAEEIGGVGAEHAAGWDRVAAVPPVERPRDRLGPLRFHVRPGRAVEEGGLQLAPAALEPDPRVGGVCRCGCARDRADHRDDRRVRTARVVAADTFLGRPPDEERGIEEVGVRAVGDEDDGVCAADDVQLLVVPGGTFCAFVLGVADLGRIAG